MVLGNNRVPREVIKAMSTCLLAILTFREAPNLDSVVFSCTFVLQWHKKHKKQYPHVASSLQYGIQVVRVILRRFNMHFNIHWGECHKIWQSSIGITSCHSQMHVGSCDATDEVTKHNGMSGSASQHGVTSCHNQTGTWNLQEVTRNQKRTQMKPHMITEWWLMNKSHKGSSKVTDEAT